MKEYSFNENEKIVINSKKTTHITSSTNKSLFSYARIFAWFGVGLLITGVISLSLPYILNAAFYNLLSTGNTDDALLVTNVYLGFVIGAAVVALISALFANLSAFSKHAIWIKITYIIYSLSIGILLSSTFLSLGADMVPLVSMAFFISAGCFIVMGLVGVFVKKDLGVLAPLLTTLLLGCLIISLVNYFLNSEMIYWIVDFVILAIVLLSVTLQMNQIKRVVENSSGDFENANTLAIYCAYSLYVFFINIFIRILRILIVLRILRKN